MKHIHIITFFIFILIAVHLCACTKTHRYRLSTTALGTIVTITVDTATPQKAHQAIEQAFSRIQYIERIMSPYNKTSDVYLINNNLEAIVQKETFEVIRLALELSHTTNGLFDVTFYSVGQLWKLQSPSFVPPSPHLIEQYKHCVGYNLIHLNYSKNQIKKDKPCVTINLGGVAKGFAISQAATELKDNGIHEGIVEAGGDLQVIGDNYGYGYTVGIKHPRDEGIIGTVTLFNGQAIATSGDYERCAFYKGQRYHHIFNPKTGYPAQSDIISVSVIANNAAVCDGYATALFIMGLQKAMEFVTKNPLLHLQYIIIDKNLHIHCTRELKKITAFDNKFHIIYF